MYPERGAIIRVNLNPTQGREQQGEARPCLILSHTEFNRARAGIIIVAPITNTLKPEIKTLISLPKNSKISGSVIAEQIRTIDLSQRWWRETDEILPSDFVDQVVAILNVIIN